MSKLCWEPRLKRLELSGNRIKSTKPLFWSFLPHCLLSSLLKIIIYRHALSCRHVRIVYRYMLPKYFQSWHSPASEHLLAHFHMLFYNNKATFFFWIELHLSSIQYLFWSAVFGNILQNTLLYIKKNFTLFNFLWSLCCFGFYMLRQTYYTSHSPPLSKYPLYPVPQKQYKIPEECFLLHRNSVSSLSSNIPSYTISFKIRFIIFIWSVWAFCIPVYTTRMQFL